MFRDKNELELYLQKNGCLNETTYLLNGLYFKRSKKDGVIELSKRDIVTSTKYLGNAAAALEWVFLTDSSMALIKNYYPDLCRMYSNDERNIMINNNYILPEIAHQFNLHSAEYHRCRFKNISNKNPKLEYTLTQSFLKPNEELIHGIDIVQDSEKSPSTSDLKISNQLTKLTNYLKLRGISVSDINDIKRDFIKQSIFNRFTKQADEHNGNWGIIYDGKRARLADCYDLEISSGMTNKVSKLSIYERLADDNSSSLNSIITQYKDLPWMQEYLQEVLSSININNAIEVAKTVHIANISEKTENYFKEFYDNRKNELQQVYDTLYVKKEPAKNNMDEER